MSPTVTLFQHIILEFYVIPCINQNKLLKSEWPDGNKHHRVGALNSLCTPILILMRKISSWRGHDWDLPGWWRATNHATSYATARGEFKNKSRLLQRQAYVQQIDIYITVGINTYLYTQEHQTEPDTLLLRENSEPWDTAFWSNDHHTPQRSIYTSQINESQIIHVNILITLCLWGERKGIEETNGIFLWIAVSFENRICW